MSNLLAQTQKSKTPSISPLRRARAETLSSYHWVNLGTCVELNDTFYSHIRSKFGWSMRIVDQAIDDAALLNRLTPQHWAGYGDAGIRLVLIDGTTPGADPCQA